MKRPRGFRSVGEVRTAADGAWSQRVREFNARYRIEIDGAEFAYSPSYGQLETVRCQPALVVGWLRRGGFRIDRVLGERFGRAATAQLGAELQSGELPTTGSPITSYILAGALLIFVGAVLVRSRPVDETT